MIVTYYLFCSDKSRLPYGAASMRWLFPSKPYNGVGYLPSECRWIVPGTMSPNGDEVLL